MPEPDDTLRAPGRPRRQVLRWAGAAASVAALSTVTGCRLRLERDAVTTPPPPTPDELARARAVADAERLLDLLDDVRRLRPDVTSLLGRVATQHQQHVSALRLPSAPTTPTPKPTAAASPSTGPALTAATALPALANAETAAADRTRQDLGDVSGDLARLLSGIAASQDCHAATLTVQARSRTS